MGALTHGNVRVSLPYDATDAVIEAFLDALPPIVEMLRNQAGAQGL
jgi:cysteine desulfurase